MSNLEEAKAAFDAAAANLRDAVEQHRAEADEAAKHVEETTVDSVDAAAAPAEVAPGTVVDGNGNPV